MINIWTPFTADRHVAAGGAALGAGIGGGIEKLGEGISKAIDAKKRRNAAAKAASALFKNSPDLQKHLGISPEDFEAMSADDKLNTTEGGIAGLKLHEELAKARDLHEAHKAQLGEFLAKQNERQAMTDIAGQLSQQGQAPGDLPFDISPEEFDRRTAPPDLMSAIAKLPRGREISPSATADLATALEKIKPRASLGPEMFKGFGFVPNGGQLNPNGTASVTFGPPDPVYGKNAEPILTKDGQPTGKALYNGKVIDLSPTDSEGKTLTQSETQMLGALDQAENDLGNLEKLFKDLGPDWGGPVSGRVKSAIGMGQNPNIAAVENAITAATPNLARGVFREVGVLTDEDIKRYKALLPTAYDTDAVRRVKMDQLRARIKQGRVETMETMRKAGRDLSGFDKKSAPEASDALKQAREAMKTKDPAAVRKRYKEITGQDYPE